MAAAAFTIHDRTRSTAFAAIWLAIVVVMMLAACGGGGNGTVTATFTNNDLTEQRLLKYQGVTSTSVRFTDQLGQSRIHVYATPILIEVGPPLGSSVSGQVESNPFHFSVNPLSGIAEEGLYTLASAALIFLGTEQLVQYWRFAQSGASFAGEITQPRNVSGPVGNLIYLPPDPAGGFTVPVAFDMAPGTRLTGTMSADQLSFRIEGNTNDRQRPFVSEVIATRVK